MELMVKDIEIVYNETLESEKGVFNADQEDSWSRRDLFFMIFFLGVACVSLGEWLYPYLEKKFFKKRKGKPTAAQMRKTK
jgi:hypothetical protein